MTGGDRPYRAAIRPARPITRPGGARAQAVRTALRQADVPAGDRAARTHPVATAAAPPGAAPSERQRGHTGSGGPAR
ncbi:hypothetical protein NGM37_51050, partial [Streptomyces sp. TRM76130]|nr:hypothetical protein [Streptomyces sp. TRM76130]